MQHLDSVLKTHKTTNSLYKNKARKQNLAFGLYLLRFLQKFGTNNLPYFCKWWMQNDEWI